MRGDLAGFSIGVTADRRADEQAALLRRRGAEVRVAPALSTRPTLANESLAAATTRVLDEPPAVVIANTSIGVLAWLAAAEAAGVDGALVDALSGATVLARGPKAAGALRQAGIEPASTDETERLGSCVDATLATAEPGAHVVLLLDGGGERPEIARLLAAGYRVTPVGTYRWDGPEDPDAVVRLVRHALEGSVDALTFTSPPAVHHLVALADRDGLGDDLRADERLVVACVGPVTAEAAHAVGLANVVHATPGRMGLMIRALASALAATCWDLVIDDATLQVQGRIVERGDVAVELTRVERAVLDVLALRPGAVVATPDLMRAVWGSPSIEPSTMHAAIARLRRRLVPVGLDVQLVRRRGYRLASSSVHADVRTAPLTSGDASLPV